MSEDAGRGVGAGRNFLQIGAADAAGVDANEHFAAADRGHGDSFKANVVHAAVDGGLHGRRDGCGWVSTAYCPAMAMKLF